MSDHRYVGTFDGSCGPPACGGSLRFAWTLTMPDNKVQVGKGKCPPRPQNTSNMAEYAGLLLLLRFLDERGIQGALIYGDSKLVVNMVTGKWGKFGKNAGHRNAPHLIPYLDECQKLWGRVRANIKWMPRELNTRADHHTKRKNF